jgi:hypothetical protein
MIRVNDRRNGFDIRVAKTAYDRHVTHVSPGANRLHI